MELPEKLERFSHSTTAVGYNNNKNQYQVVATPSDFIAEIVNRYNAYPDQQALIKQLVEALEQISENEGECCRRCEGDGRLWADGKPHYPTEQVDTVPCGNCGGSGRIYPDVKDIADTAIATAEKQLCETCGDIDGLDNHEATVLPEHRPITCPTCKGSGIKALNAGEDGHTEYCSDCNENT